jgi:hypothetical protein
MVWSGVRLLNRTAAIYTAGTSHWIAASWHRSMLLTAKPSLFPERKGLPKPRLAGCGVPIFGQGPHRKLINFVADRPGHDFRYAINFAKLNSEFGWWSKYSFEQGPLTTVPFPVMGPCVWCRRVWVSKKYTSRFG